MKTHAQVPTPLVGEGFIRVYFSSRPERSLSLTTFVDLDADDPAKILRVNPTPILELGKPGTFDEHGIMPSCAIKSGGTVFLYYSGWSRAVSVLHWEDDLVGAVLRLCRVPVLTMALRRLHRTMPKGSARLALVSHRLALPSLSFFLLPLFLDGRLLVEPLPSHVLRKPVLLKLAFECLECFLDIAAVDLNRQRSNPPEDIRGSSVSANGCLPRCDQAGSIKCSS